MIYHCVILFRELNTHPVVFRQATLKVRGKALSSEQKVKVVRKAQTENPLYLKTLLEVNINCVVNYAQSTRVLKSNCSETTKDVW